MTGAWGVYPRGQRWHRGGHRAWLVIRTAEHEVVQFDGPVLELMTEGRTRFDQRLAALGPDVLAPEFDEARFLRRLRDEAQSRQIGDALLDQRVVSGMGTVWKSEGCFLVGLSPWRRLEAVTDDEALGIIRAIRPLMARSVAGSGRIVTYDGGRGTKWVFERSGLPCRRCSTAIEFRGQGDDNRNTFWCPECQR
jgi:endonuclease-8